MTRSRPAGRRSSARARLVRASRARERPDWLQLWRSSPRTTCSRTSRGARAGRSATASSCRSSDSSTESSGIEPSREQRMDDLRALAARVQRHLRARPLPPPARPGRPLPESDGRGRRPAGARVQHRSELRHKHELAELRRRVDDEPPDADVGARRAELRLGGGRNRSRGRAHARAHAAALGDDRQLLGRPDARRRPACWSRSRL